jgi:hypothetical protein
MTIVQWLLLPAFLHVAWVMALGFRMGRARTAAIRAGRARIAEIALDNTRWPDDVRKFANNYDNQFQVPMLFYAVLPLLIVTALADAVSVVLAWAFLAGRIAHSLVHTGSNNVMRRFYGFVLSFLAVAAMWAWFALRLYVTG